MSRLATIAVVLGVVLATAGTPAPLHARAAAPRTDAAPDAEDVATSDAPDTAPDDDDSDAPDGHETDGELPASEASDEDATGGEADADAPPAPAPAPRRFVWGGTDLDAQPRADATGPKPDGASSPDTGSSPGGYLGPTETKEVAPKDGERKLLVAYIVLPLGTLAMVSGAVATWLTHPDHCQERLGRYGSDVTPGQCRGLWILNIVRTTYGSMMLASGAVLLGLGLRERKRYREWKAKHGAYVQPWFSRGRGAGTSAWGEKGGAAGLVLGGRF